MSLSDAARLCRILFYSLILFIVVFVVNYKIVKVLSSLWILLKRPYNCASIFLLAFAANEALCIYIKNIAYHLWETILNMNLQFWCIFGIFIGNQNAFYWLTYVHGGQEFTFIKLSHSIASSSKIIKHITCASWVVFLSFFSLAYNYDLITVLISFAPFTLPFILFKLIFSTCIQTCGI